MFRVFKRRKIERAIEFHTQMRRSLLYARGATTVEVFNANVNKFNEEIDDLFHRSNCEKRCIDRLTKLLEKYK